mmetsp:Transcript_33596/g.73436  ORF Transcript_33596/g.73436 Transcript_33596/m.73436 type:complete len:125 (+) Transcript_33596:800-1174(+)
MPAYLLVTANALFGSMLSNLLLTMCVMMVGPLVATLGLTTTIPLSLWVESVLLHAHSFQWGYVGGAVLVTAGVALLGWETTEDQKSDGDLAEGEEISSILESRSGPRPRKLGSANDSEAGGDDL